MPGRTPQGGLMIPWIIALIGLFLGFTAGDLLIPGIFGSLSGTHTLSALISSLIIWGFATGVATFGYLFAKRLGSLEFTRR